MALGGTRNPFFGLGGFPLAFRKQPKKGFFKEKTTPIYGCRCAPSVCAGTLMAHKRETKRKAKDIFGVQFQENPYSHPAECPHMGMSTVNVQLAIWRYPKASPLQEMTVNIDCSWYVSRKGSPPNWRLPFWFLPTLNKRIHPILLCPLPKKLISQWFHWCDCDRVAKGRELAINLQRKAGQNCQANQVFGWLWDGCRPPKSETSVSLTHRELLVTKRPD